MTVLESTYRYLIARALREHNPDQAKALAAWGEERYGLTLSDALESATIDA